MQTCSLAPRSTAGVRELAEKVFAIGKTKWDDPELLRITGRLTPAQDRTLWTLKEKGVIVYRRGLVRRGLHSRASIL